MVDSSLILRKLADLKEYLGQVGEFKAIALETYRNDWKTQRIFESMDKMAKFRNLVVHQYDKIDGAIVVTILRKHLDDFNAFRDAILQVLAKESAGKFPGRGNSARTVTVPTSLAQRVRTAAWPWRLWWNR